jgi:hypothetical protein
VYSNKQLQVLVMEEGYEDEKGEEKPVKTETDLEMKDIVVALICEASNTHFDNTITIQLSNRH